MKYFLIALKIITGFAFCILLTGLISALVFKAEFNEAKAKKYAVKERYITSQKIIIEGDLYTVTAANNIDKNIFDGFIKKDIIIKNNEQYIKGVFDFINSKSAVFPKSTPAAEEFESGIKGILHSYGDRVDPDRYYITEAGINSFASLERSSFFNAAIPIIDFETAVTVLKKPYTLLNKLFLPAWACLFILLFFLILEIGKRISFFLALYSISASAILLSVGGGIGCLLASYKNSILSISYLGDIFKSFFSHLLLTGIILFVLTQIILAVLTAIKEHKDI